MSYEVVRVVFILSFPGENEFGTFLYVCAPIQCARQKIIIAQFAGRYCTYLYLSA